MLIRAGFEIHFETMQPTPMLAALNVHPSRRDDLRTPDRVEAFPNLPLTRYRDGFGNVCSRFTVPPGGVTLKNSFIIADCGQPDIPAPESSALPVESLPDDVLVYLLGSRYCETDRMMPLAWSLFGAIPSARDRVNAITDFVHNHIRFGYEFARPDKSAWMAYEEGAGVCRDFAHLAITLCRCMNIPARYCTGYLGDIGIPPIDAPMDFSAWFDVYIDGQWYTYDARHNEPRIGRILMARGRDATDAALVTAFGPAILTQFTVHTDEVHTHKARFSPGAIALPPIFINE
ncbi:hypothetical protein NT2_07_01330 [Caenibius tardaugens NBRC 16725]|uniref:Transglutaminase-like domain-containing protein n=1 Tax=Caenibius tardaugens NBRC 16725 TaxID=1219035 RepID=U3A5V9_9SPHN|nr:transglutaminase family protein [Caenibius tardaugens]AZI35584.1 transglutaminase family protein [Caenibius tardaugens NBRC 16725]GAD50133.1 hypothetical protein NT2_07_01330 [Caenibius tardaugens NBRC 16725]